MRFSHLLGLSVMALGACESGPPKGAIALFDPSPDREEFFARPWPSDDRLTVGQDGNKRIDLSGFHNPGSAIGQYIDLVSGLPAFGTSSSVYFRFDSPIDPASLPASAAASLEPGATVFLVDVTSGSPEYGKRRPVRMRFTHDWGIYIGADWLAVMPEPGFPLREKTTYAAVLTDGLRAADGGPVLADKRFTPPAGDLPLGLPPDSHLVSATVFTTGDATSLMKALRPAVLAQPEPAIANLDYLGQGTQQGLYDVYEGTYDSPNFQEGDPPYRVAGGRIHLDALGKPEVVRTETLRFALTVPRANMPPEGWPVVLYAHGTGGDYRSFIDDGSAGHVARISDERGNIVARMAMISIDQVLHGPRDPTMSDPLLTYYNFQNLAAARDNGKQAALDDFQLLRLVKAADVTAAPKTGKPIKFDKNHIYFLGHSQGSQTGALFLAYEPEIKAAVLSGGGANLMVGLVYKTEPRDIRGIIELIVNESVDEYHPLLNLIQTFIESADPGNYARLYFREPPAGQPPKSVLVTIGLTDHYSPVEAGRALAIAAGAQPVNPMLDPIPGLELLSLPWVNPPVANNVAGGKATGVVCEYQVPINGGGVESYDGHYVVFRHPAAVLQANAFLGLHVQTNVARLVPAR